MAEDSYRIVFRGKLVDGISRAEAEANLKSRFKYSEAALAKLFTGKGVVLKSGMDRATAEKYEKALAGVGLVCDLQATGAVDVAEPEKPTPEAVPVPSEPAVAQEEPMAEPEPPVEAVAVTPEPEPETAPVEPEPAPEEESFVAAQPEATYESEDVFATSGAEYVPEQEAEETSVYMSATESGEVFETETTAVQAEEQESVYTSATDTWSDSQDLFETETTEVPEAEQESVYTSVTDTWDESEDIFGTEETEAAPVQEEPEKSTAVEATDGWEESEDIFGTEKAEAAPIQEEPEESAAVEKSDSWEEDEDVFGPEEDQVVPVQEEAAVASLAPDAETADESEDDFVAEPTPAAAEAGASFFEEFPAAGGPVNATILELLKQTKPWVRLISVLLFISAGFGVLAIGVVLLGGMMGGMGHVADTPTMLMFVAQMLSMLLYLIPAYFLFKYASAIGFLLKGGGEAELEAALGYQKSFWRFSGILTLICLVLGVLGVVAAIMIPLMVR